MEKFEKGFKKQSFAASFHNAEIWCEHLDSLCNKRELVLEKFQGDLVKIAKPSMTSLLIVVMDETLVDLELLDYIIDSLNNLPKIIRKVAFVGLNPKNQKHIKKRNKDVEFTAKYFDDLEKSKEWLVGKLL